MRCNAPVHFMSRVKGCRILPRENRILKSRFCHSQLKHNDVYSDTFPTKSMILLVGPLALLFVCFFYFLLQILLKKIVVCCLPSIFDYL